MTIAELTGQIDERLRTARDEIERLLAARGVLATVPADRAEPATASASASERPGRARRVTVRTPKPHLSQRSRRPKSTAVVALARELDAGLRTRV